MVKSWDESSLGPRVSGLVFPAQGAEPETGGTCAAWEGLPLPLAGLHALHACQGVSLVVGFEHILVLIKECLKFCSRD